MEIVVIFVILMALCFCMGMGIETFLFILCIMMTLFMIFVFAFFLISASKITGSKKVRAEFVKTDKHPKYGYKAAYYKVGDEVYPNVFPCEVVLKNVIYSRDKTYNVRVARKKNCVFDTNAYLCTVIGLVSGAVLSSVLMWITFHLGVL